MKDIKELALKVAGMDDLMGPRDTFAFTKERMADFATRLIAAYTERQEPVATIRKNISGQIYIDWAIQDPMLKHIGMKLFAAPVKDSLTTEPEPSEFSAEQRDKDWSTIKGAAPSSEEVREMVEELCEAEDGPVRRKGLLKDATDLIERIAARVPDGCVVVPKDLIDAAKNLLAVKGRHHTELAYKQLCQALIAAGEVKP